MSSETPLTPPPYDPAGVPQFGQGIPPTPFDDPSYPASVGPYAVQPPQYPGPAYGLQGQLPTAGYGLQPRAQEPLATISLVFGILGILFVLPVIGPIVAIVSGHVARGRILRAGGFSTGMAVTGMVLGYIALTFSVLIGAFILVVVAVYGSMPR